MHPLRGASLRSAPRSSRQEGQRSSQRSHRESPEGIRRPQNSSPEKLQRAPRRPRRRLPEKAQRSIRRQQNSSPEKLQIAPRRLPRRLPERAQRSSPEDSPEPLFFDPYSSQTPYRCQNVWFSIGFTTKTKIRQGPMEERPRTDPLPRPLPFLLLLKHFVTPSYC